MNILQKMTPEQISALTPECLKILIQQDSKHLDIEKMRNFFNKLGYECIRSFSYSIISDKKTSFIDDVDEILQKYPTDKFYLYIHLTKNWCNILSETFAFKLFTESEAILLLPTGCELNKITFNSTNFPLDLKDYIYNPCEKYEQEGYYSITQKIYNLCFRYDNIYFIHPGMLAFAKHFYS